VKLLVTGGAGFIGANFARRRVAAGDEVVVLDKLTYAGHLENLDGVLDDLRFVQGDICDPGVVGSVVTGDLDAVVNFAAESHVDRSIQGAGVFVQTNVVGVQVLLDAVRRADSGVFCQVSTDEVYGSAPDGVVFDEGAALEPSSPYSASKAAADLLCMGYHRTHGTPVVITRCTNNYGPRQFPEKLIPLFLLRAVADEELPLYGDGLNERDWLYVDDHCAALDRVIEAGRPGRVYNIAADHPVTNREIVQRLLTALDRPWDLVCLVADRPAHDRRYAIDASRIRDELGWAPSVDLEEGLARTVRWYAERREWMESVTGPEFEVYCQTLYGDR